MRAYHAYLIWKRSSLQPQRHTRSLASLMRHTLRVLFKSSLVKVMIALRIASSRIALLIATLLPLCLAAETWAQSGRGTTRWNDATDQDPAGYASAGDRTLAFPGAEGYGKYTRGGRGGAVYEVTNLHDAGPGSLRAAVEASGPRTVVFRISGTIDLESPLTIRNPYLTIAGQTAPGDGIAIKDHPLVIGADEVIIRYVRVRLGDQTDNDADAISSRYTKNIILDHVSASWSIDETMSIYHADSVTVQWSLVSESLYDTHHEKGAHGFGGIWGANHSTYHHNLLAHHTSRNPRFASGCGYTDYRNNVVFNWGYNSTYGGEKQQVGDPRFDFCTINMVANYYKPGPATQVGEVMHRIASPSSREGVADYGKWYIADNVVHGNDAVTADNWNGGVQPEDSSHIPALKLDAPFASMPIDQQGAEAAYESVLDNVGATLPRRDTLDARIVDETRNGYATYEGDTYENDHAVADPARKSGIIDSQADVGGWPELRSTTAPTDTDHDGMPDDWEAKRGLNPNDGADGSRVAADGYTMLEKYLNGIEFEVPVPDVLTTRLSETAIEVHWADIYLAEEGFVVERSVDGGAYAPLAEVGSNVSSVTDESAGGTDRYAYRVKVKPSRDVR